MTLQHFGMTMVISKNHFNFYYFWNQMNKKVKKVVDQISSILVSGIDAKQVYLFGSHAQNTANKESDIDIFVVADLTGKKKIEITQQARRLLLKKFVMPVDILVCDSIDFESRKNNQTTFEYIIATEGQKIYG
jgi:predicted nucleotidyltransferase